MCEFDEFLEKYLILLTAQEKGSCDQDIIDQEFEKLLKDYAGYIE